MTARTCPQRKNEGRPTDSRPIPSWIEEWLAMVADGAVQFLGVPPKVLEQMLVQLETRTRRYRDPPDSTRGRVRFGLSGTVA